MKSNNEKTTYKRREVAAMLEVTPHTIRRYELQGLITPIRLSQRTLRYPQSEVDRLMNTMMGGTR